MQRVFKTRYFHRWMRKTSLSDLALCRAVAEMMQGLIDADLLTLSSAEIAVQLKSDALQEICDEQQR